MTPVTHRCTLSDLALARAQAVEDGDTVSIVLCDRAMGRAASDSDLDRLYPPDAARMVGMTAWEALQDLGPDPATSALLESSARYLATKGVRK